MDNVWRVRMAAFDRDASNAVVLLLDLTTDQGFRYRVAADAYLFHWTPSAAQASLLNKYATPDGAARYGTSIWFEDVTGHVAPPEKILWSRPREMRVTVEPAQIPFGVAVPVTIRAFDAFDGTKLKDGTGVIVINEVSTGKGLGEQMPYTFNPLPQDPILPGPGGPRINPRPALPTGMVTSVVEYPDTDIPFVFYRPQPPPPPPPTIVNITVDPPTFAAGQPIQVLVTAQDSNTHAAIDNGTVKIGGNVVGTTNVRFLFTAPKPPRVIRSPRLPPPDPVPISVVIIVSKPGYPNASITVVSE